MARKDDVDRGANRAWSDIIGIILITLAVLMLAALVSYDRFDLPVNRVPAHSISRNWIGKAGAFGADGLFKWCGAGAYLLPVLCLGFGLGCFFTPLRYLRRRWGWAVVLLGTAIGLLDLYTDRSILDRVSRNLAVPEPGFLERLTLNLSAPSAGGVLGMALNKYVFGYFGTLGATLLFLTLYLISLYGLTNFHLGEWLRAWWQGRAARPKEDVRGDGKAMERRARELEREARKLQEQIDKAAAKEESPKKPAVPVQAPEVGAPPDRAGLGPDLKPVPEPTVRDLSVPQQRALVQAVAKPQLPPAAVEILPRKAESSETSTPPLQEVGPAKLGEELGQQSKPAPTARRPEPLITLYSPDSSERVPSPMAAAHPPVPSGTPVSDPEVELRVVESDIDPGEHKATEVPAKAEVAKTEGIAPVTAPPEEAAPFAKPRSPAQRKPKPIAVAAPPLIGNYKLPDLSLLALPDLSIKPTESKEDLMANARLMQQTLAQFDIEVSLGDITKGPTITRYELHPAPGVKLEKITALTNNIAAALKAERIHILAPVPGKSSVGVEVPNLIKSKVIMRELLESEEWRSSKARVPLALGKDVYGHPIVADLAEMPHLLIAGSTGSGKSVCVNAIVACLLFKFSPDQLRFVMIDPKVVELQQYNALPHLVVPVVTDPKKVILALRWVVNEMEKRYQIFARVGVRNIKSFNDRPKDKPLPPREPELPLAAKKEKIEPGAEGFAVEVDEEIVVPREEEIVIPEKLSYIVVIIDELADLMLVAPADVEMAIARITQMARAAGIHCIVATQRPSVDVITGVIKANIPCRIAFQVAAKVDSRTILDAMGADKLLGKGDMLYLPPGSAKLIRAQGALITDKEIDDIVQFIARQGKPSYEMEIHKQLAKSNSTLDQEEGIDEDEDLIEQCIEVIRSEQKASVSLLQRRLRLGYTRAARIMDELENRGIVEPERGAEPRDILIDLDGAGADGAGEGS